MLQHDQRTCDTCDAVIPRGTAYRVGYPTPDAIAGWFEDDPRYMPGFTQDATGVVRFDLCVSCAADAAFDGIAQRTVDPLQ